MISAIRRPIRMLITSGELTAENFNSQKESLINTIGRAAAVGIEMLQIREKRLPTRLLFQLATEAKLAVNGSATKVIVNERLDVAIAAGVDGVHLTSTSIPVDTVRRLTSHEFLLGVSTHSLSEVVAARKQRADYVLFGPVFATPGKEDPCGIGELNNICSAVRGYAVIAIGGIDESNSDAILASGASGFAAIRYLNDFVNMSA